MDADQLKKRVALAALDYVEPKLKSDSVVGVGTGSTTNHFIDALGTIKHKFDAAVSSSERSAERLRDLGIDVIDSNAANEIVVYVDGADEVDQGNALIKGGGAALTREKIVAASSNEFVCIVDASKLVETLGAFPLPVEVIPMARGLVARKLVALGGQPVYREGTITDNHNVILDVYDLDISDPDALESEINNIVGVVTNGIFAANRPQKVLVAAADGVREHAGSV